MVQICEESLGERVNDDKNIIIKEVMNIPLPYWLRDKRKLSYKMGEIVKGNEVALIEARKSEREKCMEELSNESLTQFIKGSDIMAKQIFKDMELMANQDCWDDETGKFRKSFLKRLKELKSKYLKSESKVGDDGK
jgi:hypothetical protein